MAAISMTLMMKAIAKAQIRLFRTQVCFTVGLEPSGKERRTKVREKQNHTSASPAASGWSLAGREENKGEEKQNHRFSVSGWSLAGGEPR